jgi:hypothetical protein
MAVGGVPQAGSFIPAGGADVSTISAKGGKYDRVRVAFQLEFERSRSSIPYASDRILASSDEVQAIWAETSAGDWIRMFQAEQLITLRHLPNAGGAVRTGGDHKSTVRAEGALVRAQLRAEKRGYGFKAVHAEDLTLASPLDGQNAMTVWAKLHRVDFSWNEAHLKQFGALGQGRTESEAVVSLEAFIPPL